MKGFVEPAPGEHPRLFFRKADVPELRRRATETEEGKAIVAQLRQLLGNNGDKLPDHWNKRFPVNIGAKGNDELPVGAFTFSHPAGYGMLYQLTGEKKYADLAQEVPGAHVRRRPVSRHGRRHAGGVGESMEPKRGAISPIKS